MARRFSDEEPEDELPDEWEGDADDAEDEEEEESADEEDGESELTPIIEQANELIEDSEFRKAVRLWRRSMDRFADEPEAWYHFGRACFRLLADDITHEAMWENDADNLGIHEEALSALEEAVSMDEEHADAWNLIGSLHALRRNYRSAAEAWERSLEIRPNQRQVKRDLADAKAELGEDE